jgi:hypothetical protein
VARKNAVFWPAAILARRIKISIGVTSKNSRGGNRLEYVDANKGLIARWLGRALGFFGPETELPVGRILTPSDGHNSTFLFIR